MRRIVFTIALIIAPSSSATQAQFTEAELAAATITLKLENRCGFSQELPTDIQQCPDYTVGLNGTGTVTYQGSGGVRTMGKRSHTIPPQDARRVIDRFLQASFLSFGDVYNTVHFNGYTVSRIDHAVGTTLTLSVGTRTKSVYAFYGVPYAIKELEWLVEDVTGVRRYTGRPQSQAGKQAVHGRITDSNGTALSGVEVSMPGEVWYSGTTDRDGRYRIQGVFADDYVLIASLDGLVTAVSSVEIRRDTSPLEWSPALSITSPAPLVDLRSRVNLLAKGTTADCGTFLLVDGPRQDVSPETLKTFLACAIDANQQNRATRVLIQRPSRTSWVAHGLVTGAYGVWLFTFDSAPCSGPGCIPSFVVTACGDPFAIALPTGGATIGCRERF